MNWSTVIISNNIIVNLTGWSENVPNLTLQQTEDEFLKL